MRCGLTFLFILSIQLTAFAATSTTEFVLPGQSSGDQAGFAVAISGNTAVVGAPYASANRSESGLAYVFVRAASAGTWGLQAILSASDGETGDMFGYSVAIVDDLIVVGAPGDDTSSTIIDNGSVYMFTRNGKTWTQRDKKIGSTDDFLGVSVSVTGAGTSGIIAAGASQDDGTVADQGSVSTYTFNGTTGTFQQKIVLTSPAASDYFGRSVAINGTTLIAGAFARDIAGKSSQGSASVYVLSGGTWTLQSTLIASDGLASDFFGFSVGLSSDVAIVGTQGDDIGSNSSQGSAYVFRRTGTTWTQEQKLTDPDGVAGDNFGYSVAIEGETAAVGAYGVDSGGSLAGAAFKFLFKGSWLAPQKLQSSSFAPGQYLGRSIAIENGNDEEVIVAGAPLADVGGTDKGYASVFEPPLVTVTATDSSAAELPVGTGTFRVARTGTTTSALTVSFNLTGSTAGATDFGLSGTASATTVSIPIGASFVDIVVTPANDIEMEPTETVKLNVVNGSAYNLGPKIAATVSILDNDTPVVFVPVITIAASDATAGEPSDPGTFTITRTDSMGNANTAGDLTVQFVVSGTATQDADYTLSATEFTLVNGVSTATVDVDVNNDGAVELGETVILTLQPGAYTPGASSTATVNVSSDDIGPLVTNVAPLTAPYSSFTLTVTGAMFAANSQIFLNGEGVATNTSQFATGTLTATINPALLGSTTVPGFNSNPAGLAGTINVTVRNGAGGNPSNDNAIKIYSGPNIGQWMVATTVDDSKAAQSLRLALKEVAANESVLFDGTVFALNQSDSATTIAVSIQSSELPFLDKGGVLIDARNRRVNIDGAEGQDGLVITSDGNQIYGLTLIQFESGIVIDNAKNNVLGGNRLNANDGAISGNGEGLRLSDNNTAGLIIRGSEATGNTVKGCWIGLGPQGITALGNQNGIRVESGASSNTIGGTVAGEANVISGNKVDGIDVNSAGTSGNKILGNLIGTDKNGTGDLGNGSHGIFFTTGTVGNTVGGDPMLGQGNRIAFNKGFGVVVQNAETRQNRVIGNRIYKNVLGGISLENGGNDGLAKPDIDSIVRTGSFSAKLLRDGDDVQLIGRTAKATGTVEIFNDEGSQGGEVLGRAMVTNGTWTFSTPTANGAQNFTATFTDVDGNTSVFNAFGGSFVDDFDADGIPNTSDLDNDGDGYSDIFEVAVGTEPFNASSNPGLSGGAATPPLTLLKGSVKLSFSKPNSDALTLSGTLPLTDGTNPKGLPVVAEVGGLVFQQFVSGGKEFKLSKPKNNLTKYSFKLSKQALAASFVDEGFTNTTIQAGTVTLPVTLSVNGVGYRGQLQMKYTAKQGKTGSAK